MQQRVFTPLHIYSIVDILSTNNGTQIQTFFNLGDAGERATPANVVRGLRFRLAAAFCRLDLRCSEWSWQRWRDCRVFTIHFVLLHQPGPVGPVRMRMAPPKLGGRTLVGWIG